MNPIFASSLAAARRAMKRRQRIPRTRRVPMSRLLAGEAVHGLRQLARPQRGVPAVLAASVATLALSPQTPGPVASRPLLVVVAVAAAAIGASLGARLSGSGSVSTRVSTGVLREAISGIGTFVAFTLLVLVVGWLLSAVIALIFF